jgi:hypothetical protein
MRATVAGAVQTAGRHHQPFLILRAEADYAPLMQARWRVSHRALDETMDRLLVALAAIISHPGRASRPKSMPA